MNRLSLLVFLLVILEFTVTGQNTMGIEVPPYQLPLNSGLKADSISVKLYQPTDKLLHNPLYSDFLKLADNLHETMYYVAFIEQNDTINIHIQGAWVETILKFGNNVRGVFFCDKGTPTPFFILDGQNAKTQAISNQIFTCTDEVLKLIWKPQETPINVIPMGYDSVTSFHYVLINDNLVPIYQVYQSKDILHQEPAINPQKAQ